jgi:hypothetical protein
MKKYFILLTCVITFSATVAAQEEVTVVEKDILGVVQIVHEHTEGTANPPEQTEETKSSVFLDGVLDNSSVFFWRKKKANHAHWGGLRFAFTDLDGLQNVNENGINGVDLKAGKSYSVTLERLIAADHPIDSHWVLATGLGLDFTRYRFTGNIGLNGNTANNITQFEPAPDGVNYKASRLLIDYITVPVVLEYQTKAYNNRKFFVSGGVEGLIKYYSKSILDLGGGNKQTLGRDLNIHPVNLRFVAKIGLGNVGIFGYYQPFPMFEKGKGPDVCPFAIGFTVGY